MPRRNDFAVCVALSSLGVTLLVLAVTLGIIAHTLNHPYLWIPAGISAVLTGVCLGRALMVP